MHLKWDALPDQKYLFRYILTCSVEIFDIEGGAAISMFVCLALDLDLHSLRQLVRLEFAQGPELLGTMRDGV